MIHSSRPRVVFQAGYQMELSSPIKDIIVTALIASNAVFYGHIVLQRIIELIAGEGEGVTTADVSITGGPFYETHDGTISFKGFAFSGGSEHAEFQLVATLTLDTYGPDEEVSLIMGREALFDSAHNPLEPPALGFEFKRRDISANDLEKASRAVVLKLDPDAFALVGWLIYSLFVEYHISVDALEADHDG